VVVGSDDDLRRAGMFVDAVTWVDQPVDGPVLVQCSAHGAPRPATIEREDAGVVSVTWREPERRIAPGQSVVFYDGADRRVLGGGICR
jgi:tRNA-specific 2-thiouridylase